MVTFVLTVTGDCSSSDCSYLVISSFFVVSNLILIGVFWLVSGLFLYSDITGRPKWMTYYKVQPDKNVPVSTCTQLTKCRGNKKDTLKNKRKDTDECCFKIFHLRSP